MIYPTARAILFAAAGAPLALGLGAVAPGWWVAGAVWAVAALALTLADALIAPSAGSVRLSVEAPGVLHVGRDAAATALAHFAGRSPGGGVELSLGTNERLNVSPRRGAARVDAGEAGAALTLKPLRRGQAVFERLWARWRGPLGLAWVQATEALDRTAPITPDTVGVAAEALKLFTRDAALGLKPQVDTGQGSEFHALRDYVSGMDRRAIDWKQSARHGKLVGREHRTERNHPVILAIDSGRLMSAPIGGAPRLDRAIHAALLLGFAALKLGDRVGLFAFDSRPRVASGAAAGVGAYPLLQKLAASIDYSTEETNFTLGLSALAERLDRRALVVMFTDFTDPTSAELMLETVGLLLRAHLVLFVTFRDDELNDLALKAPDEPDDVSRAVVAAALLRRREVVLERLRRIGVQVVEAPADDLGPALLNRYLDTKRRGLL